MLPALRAGCSGGTNVDVLRQSSNSVTSHSPIFEAALSLRNPFSFIFYEPHSFVVVSR